MLLRSSEGIDAKNMNPCLKLNGFRKINLVVIYLSGFGFLPSSTYKQGIVPNPNPKDPYIASPLIHRIRLKRLKLSILLLTPILPITPPGKKLLLLKS